MIGLRQVFYRHIITGSKRQISSLYITGDKASTHYAILTPCIDFEERIKNKTELQKNIELRKLKIDIDKFEKHWNFYKHLDEQRIILEITKTAISDVLTKLMTDPEKNAEDIEKLKVQAKLAKDDYKLLKEYLYGVEETAAVNSLTLPNVLDKRTPCESEAVIHRYAEVPSKKSKFHLDIAVNSNLIEYVNPTCVFLKNDAALFELAVTNYFHNSLADLSFVSYSNCSFARTIVVEGCCTDFLNKSVYTLETEHEISSRLHIVGGATLYSFMAYFARFSIQLGYLPLKLFTTGRQYKPVIDKEKSLFNLEQNTCVELFIVTKDETDMNKEFDNIIFNVITLYEQLKHHFRLVYLPAYRLKDYESLCVSIQMYSSYSQNYLEVGRISLCDNYLSKRLLVTYTENKERQYARIISGTLVNIQNLLACVLEYNDINNDKLLSPVLQKYSPL